VRISTNKTTEKINNSHRRNQHQIIHSFTSDHLEMLNEMDGNVTYVWITLVTIKIQIYVWNKFLP